MVAVPLVHATWLCRPGKEPLLVGEGAGSASTIDFAAAELDIADDLTRFSAHDAQILVPASTPLRLRLDHVLVTGLHPFSAPSSVAPWARASAIVGAALLSAIVATLSALRGESSVRAVAWGVALAGPAATLVALRACEQRMIGDARLMLVPVAALVATLLARGLALVLTAAARARRGIRARVSP